LAMNFLGPKNLLLQRVHRIVYNRNKSLNIHELLFVMFSVVCSILLLVGTGATVPDKMLQTPAVHQAPSAKYVSYAVPQTKQQSQPTSILPGREQYPGAKHFSREQVSVIKSNARIEIKEKQPGSENTMVTKSAASQSPVLSVVSEKEPGTVQERQHKIERTSAELDRIQAEKDRAAAELDRRQADKDRAQAELDRKQAELDRIQADKDRAQAEIDRKQADRDRAEAGRLARPAPVIK
jgi:bla regulator protein BlaR1